MQIPPHTALGPVIALDTRILILGSFPGVASLAAQQYYAHPRNQFWRLMAALLGEDFPALPYAERLPRLLAHRIGLWDVIADCERSGSLDSRIRNPRWNDFAALRQRCPALTRVAFNGQTAGRFAPRLAVLGLQTMVLPSSSSANAQFSFEQKLHVWRGVLGEDGSISENIGMTESIPAAQPVMQRHAVD